MLFSEFPNGGPLLPETDKGLKITASETRQILPLLINHPSIVRYGGGNEWYTDAKESKQMAQLREICNEVDPTRPFHDSDPETYGQRHGPHWYKYEYHYQLYNTGYPMFTGPADPMEWTEYGASAIPSLATLKKIIPKESLWPIKETDPYWTWHKGFNAYLTENWLARQQFINLFGELPDLETTVSCSQFVQAEGLRYANQSLRRKQWHCSAFVSWTYNEPWPNAAHGCIVEYYGILKMAYYYVKQSCAAIDVSCVYDDLRCNSEKPVKLDVWLSSNLAEEVKGHYLRWRVFNTRGELCFDEKENIEILPDQSNHVTTLDWQPGPDMDGEVALVYVEVLNSNDESIAYNLYTFGIQESEDSEKPLLKKMLNAEQTTIKAQIADKNESGSFSVEIKNTGKNPALFVEITTGGTEGIRVYFSENYFFLPPGESRMVDVSVKEDTGQLSFPGLIIKAWNRNVLTVSLKY
jgi:beta-mannosidase